MVGKTVEKRTASAIALVAGLVLAACQPAEKAPVTDAPQTGAAPVPADTAGETNPPTPSLTETAAPAPDAAQPAAGDDHDHDHGDHDGDGDKDGAMHTGEAHVHGAAEMVASVEAPGLVIGFSSAMYNIVGFERAPANDEEWTALESAAVLLAAPGQEMIGIPAQAGCIFTNAKTVFRDAEGVEFDTLTRQTAARHVDVEWVFTCTNPSALGEIKLGVFEAFSRLESVDLVTYGPAGERSHKLTPQKLTATLPQ